MTMVQDQFGSKIDFKKVFAGIWLFSFFNTSVNSTALWDEFDKFLRVVPFTWKSSIEQFDGFIDFWLFSFFNLRNNSTELWNELKFNYNLFNKFGRYPLWFYSKLLTTTNNSVDALITFIWNFEVLFFAPIHYSIFFLT